MKKKEKIQIAVTIVLVLVLLILAADIFKKRKNNAQKQLAVSAPAPITPVKPSFYLELEKEAEGLSVDRDPFSRPVVTASENESPALVLGGIVWDAQNPAAVINDQVLKVGSAINGNTVMDIQKDRVILSDGFNQFELYLGKK